jgi:hypothetical protein
MRTFPKQTNKQTNKQTEMKTNPPPPPNQNQKPTNQTENLKKQNASEY